MCAAQFGKPRFEFGDFGGGFGVLGPKLDNAALEIVSKQSSPDDFGFELRPEMPDEAEFAVLSKEAFFGIDEACDCVFKRKPPVLRGLLVIRRHRFTGF